VWEQIRTNRRRSAAVVALLGAVLVATGIALGELVAVQAGGDPRAAAFGGGALGLGVWLVLWLVSVTQGDRIMLALAGAREIQKRDHPQLVNVVEEMAIAAALPAPPRVFIVDDPSPNAFATGRNATRAAVSVTTGLLARLDRDELQGVVAHEIGHVRNRDVAFMATAGVMLGTIVLLADLGNRLVWYGSPRRSRSSSSDGESGGGQAVLFVLALIFMILAPLLAQILYFALSRRREYLADASSALFTRYPEGLASALEKIGRSASQLADQGRVTAPMYIVSPRATALFSTHPPLERRIEILRRMAGGAGLAAYEAAYRSVRGGSVVGPRTLATAEAVPARTATPEATPVEAAAARSRQASDALLSAGGYQTVPCSCGARVKVPPPLQGQVTNCPRCGAKLAA